MDEKSESKKIKEFVSIGDRIFLLTAISQAAIVVALCLGGLALYSWHAYKVESRIIRTTFSKFEPALTEGFYVSELIQASDVHSLPALSEFENSLKLNQVDASIEVVDCQERGPGLFHFNIGSMALKKCIRVLDKRNYVLPGIVMAFSILVFSIFFSAMLWALYRRHLKEKLFQPFVSSISTELNDAAIWRVAKQVSHDIRSPLSALSVVVSSAQGLPEDQRSLVKAAIKRINDIANDLLQKSKRTLVSADLDIRALDANSLFKQEYVPVLLDQLIKEKRAQFSHVKNLQFNHEFSGGVSAFASVRAIEFCRAISNLINNSVEACATRLHGQINLCVRKYGHKTEILIIDNGVGISHQVLSVLGERPVTQGKEYTQSGHGLGVYYSKQVIANCGGSMKIHSSNQGTSVQILLPSLPTPNWFVGQINVVNKKFLVGLGGDRDAQSVLATRFHRIANLEQLSFDSVEVFSEYVLKNLARVRASLYLVDFEAVHWAKTGLDLIAELGISESAILLTDRIGEPEIQRQALNLGVRILPKFLIEYITIEADSRSEEPSSHI